jgi:hypothetical protein
MNMTPIFPSAQSTSTTPPPASGTGSTSPQGLNTMFLQLLVAQLKNQSPLNPLDPTQFVGQLAQFSELSEVTQIYQLLQQSVPPAPGGSQGTTGAGTSNSGKSSSVPLHLPPTRGVSSAVSAAQEAIPDFTFPAASFLNRQIQGVF